MGGGEPWRLQPAAARLHGRLIGCPVEARVTCACGEDLEVVLPLDAVASAPDPAPRVEIDAEGSRAFRLPRLSEIGLAGEPLALARCCALDGGSDFPEDHLAALDDLAEADPAADPLDLVCPACGTPITARADLALFVARDLDLKVRGLLAEDSRLRPGLRLDRGRGSERASRPPPRLCGPDRGAGMSYLQALDRTARGHSDALPRPRSRYELPEAAWEIEGEAPRVATAVRPEAAPQPPARPARSPSRRQLRPRVPPMRGTRTRAPIARSARKRPGRRRSPRGRPPRRRRAGLRTPSSRRRCA